MNLKESKRLERAAAISDYEHNLRLHLDSKRKDLDILLTSVMPGQVNHIKTIVWINLIYMGIAFKLFDEIVFHTVYLVSYAFSAIAVIIVLSSLLQKRYIRLAGIDDMNRMAKIEDGKYAKVHGLNVVLSSTCRANERNKVVTTHYSKYLFYGTLCTFMSFVSFGLIWFYILQKG